MIPAVITAILVSIGGPGSSGVCDADVNRPAPLPANTVGWVQMGTKVAHLHPRICRGIKLNPAQDTTGEFALALAVVAHEAWHIRGIWSEGCANLRAELISFDLLRRFWRIPFYTALSWEIGGKIHQLARRQPPQYFPFPWSCG